MESRAHATWSGNLTEGSGTTTLGTGVAGPLPVSWPSRTEAPNGRTSPEELIAAAHAACFCMALSAGLAGRGYTAERLDVDAVATFGQLEQGWGFTTMALTVAGTVPGISAEDFAAAANAAKDGCPVSKALAGNVEITLTATLR